MDNYELYHHGVKGMKWGVRRYRAKRSESKRRDWSEDARTASEIKKKSVKQMSNAELRKLNERSQLERQYSNLNPSAAKKGLTFVAGAAGVMGTALTLYNNSGNLIKAGKSIGNKIVDIAGNMVMKDLAKHING